MTRGRLFSALHPLGPLSPLHPSNPFHPFRAMGMVRKPPAGGLDDAHGSLLRAIYGDLSLESVYGGRERVEELALSCSESWRTTIECLAKGSGGKDARLSLVSNVQLTRMPIFGWVAHASVIVRNPDEGKTWSLNGAGDLEPGDEFRFRGRSLVIFGKRVGDNWNCTIEGNSDGAALKLEIEHDPVAFLGDPGLARGWCDNNPDGFIPYWTSYRTRNGRPTGKLQLPDGTSYKIEPDAETRFDHQTFHMRAGYGDGLSPPALAETAISRPQCLRYQARLSFKGPLHAGTPRLNLVAYEVRNGHSGQVLKRAAFLFDDNGQVARVDRRTLRMKRPGTGRDQAAGTPDLEFEMPDMSRDRQTVDPWYLKGSRFELSFQPRDTTTLRYPLSNRLRCDVHTSHGLIHGTDGLGNVGGSATREIIDSLRSMSVDV